MREIIDLNEDITDLFRLIINEKLSISDYNVNRINEIYPIQNNIL